MISSQYTFREGSVIGTTDVQVPDTVTDNSADLRAKLAEAAQDDNTTEVVSVGGKIMCCCAH